MNLIDRIDARLNPVWIKEVRQSLRSRLFRVGYLFTLLIAAMASVLAVSSGSEATGGALFAVVYAALIFSICGLVPFYVFFTAPGEGQGRAMDLVLLTGLSPGRLAAGRLLSAMTSNALFASAFLPFLAVAALLPGVDLAAGAVLLVGAFVAGACTSSVAMALGAVLKSRILRGLVGLGLSGVIFYVCGGAVVLALGLLDRPEQMLDPEFPLVLAGVFSLPLTMGVYGFGATAAVLAHPEENRSTPLRLATVIFAGLGVLGLIAIQGSVPGGVEGVAVPALVMLGLLGFPLGVFLVEPDRLGRRTRVTLPRRPVALLLAPLLPGGQRAVTFAAGVLVVFTGAASLMLGTVGSGPELVLAREALWTALGYGAIYLLLPALVLRPWMEHTGVRLLALLGMPGLMLAGLLIPTFLGFALEWNSWMETEHFGNPFWVVARFFTGRAEAGDGLAVQLLGLAALVASLPRAARGYLEVAEAADLLSETKP